MTLSLDEIIFIRMLHDSGNVIMLLYALASAAFPCWFIIKVVEGKSIPAGINPAQPVYQRKRSHSHTHTHHFRVSNQPTVHVSGLWKETQRGFFSHLLWLSFLWKPCKHIKQQDPFGRWYLISRLKVKSFPVRTHLSPARHPPSACQRWALLEEAGKPLIGRLGQETQQQNAWRAERGRLHKDVRHEMWLANSTCASQDKNKSQAFSKVPLFINSLSCNSLVSQH